MHAREMDAYRETVQCYLATDNGVKIFFVSTISSNSRSSKNQHFIYLSLNKILLWRDIIFPIIFSAASDWPFIFALTTINKKKIWTGVASSSSYLLFWSISEARGAFYVKFWMQSCPRLIANKICRTQSTLLLWPIAGGDIKTWFHAFPMSISKMWKQCLSWKLNSTHRFHFSHINSLLLRYTV